MWLPFGLAIEAMPADLLDKLTAQLPPPVAEMWFGGCSDAFAAVDSGDPGRHGLASRAVNREVLDPLSRTRPHPEGDRLSPVRGQNMASLGAAGPRARAEVRSSPLSDGCALAGRDEDDPRPVTGASRCLLTGRVLLCVEGAEMA